MAAVVDGERAWREGSDSLFVSTHVARFESEAKLKDGNGCMGNVVNVERSAAFQRTFLFPAGASWTFAELAAVDLGGVDNSRWHIPESDRPNWRPRIENLPSIPSSIPSLSPLHAWLGYAMRMIFTSTINSNWQGRVKQLFDVLLRTGCDDRRILNGDESHELTPLSYSLRIEGALPRTMPLTSGELLAFRLLMSHHLVDASLVRFTRRDSALRTALVYRHHPDVILQILGAYPNPHRALVYCSSSICVQLLQYQELATAFLPGVAACWPNELFVHSHNNAGDFAGELAQCDTWPVWRSITARIAPSFRLPVRPFSPWIKAENWRDRDGLRSAIRAGYPDRALWMLEHTADDDLDSYDCGGHTTLMRAIVIGGPPFRALVLAMLARAPALDIDTRELCLSPPPMGQPIGQQARIPMVPAERPVLPEPGTASGLVLGKTARELLVENPQWKTSLDAITVLAEFEAAQARANNRRELAKPLLASALDVPGELRPLIAAYAALESQQ